MNTAYIVGYDSHTFTEEATMPKASASKAAPPKVAAPRPPSVVAIERLAKLAMANTPAHKMTATVTGIVADWRREHIGPGDLRDRIEALREDVELGIEAAENFVSEAETDGQRRGAQGQVDSLRAVQQVLGMEMERAFPSSAVQ